MKVNLSTGQFYLCPSATSHSWKYLEDGLSHCARVRRKEDAGVLTRRSVDTQERRLIPEDKVIH